MVLDRVKGLRMTTEQRIAKNYRRLRKPGTKALGTYRTAKTLEAWRKAHDAGLVRIRVVPDECCDIANLEGDTYNPAANPDIRPERLERERAEFVARIERDGVWGIVAEYRLEQCEACQRDPAYSCNFVVHPCHYNPDYSDNTDHAGWEHGASCYGFVGDDATDAVNQSDLMTECLAELAKELRSRQLVGMGV